MATFSFKKRVCTLDFGAYRYELPLSENELDRILGIAEDMEKRLRAINGNDKAAWDEAYNLSLDGIDHILGEGAGEEIMSLCDHDPSLSDVKDVIDFISVEYKEAFTKEYGTHAQPIRKGGRR